MSSSFGPRASVSFLGETMTEPGDRLGGFLAMLGALTSEVQPGDSYTRRRKSGAEGLLCFDRTCRTEPDCAGLSDASGISRGEDVVDAPGAPPVGLVSRSTPADARTDPRDGSSCAPLERRCSVAVAKW